MVVNTRIGKRELEWGYTVNCCFGECMICCEGDGEPPYYRHCFNCDYGWNRREHENWDDYHKRKRMKNIPSGWKYHADEM
jgi:hypothetical protein